MLDEMYADISGKIKGLAKWVFVIEAVLSVICGAIYGAVGDEFDFFVGLLIIGVGVLAAWISSWFLYGFGEIIEKLGEIEYNTRCSAKNDKIVAEEIKAKFSYNENADEAANPSKNENAESAKPVAAPAVHKWRCPSCGQTISSYPCGNCGFSNS